MLSDLQPTSYLPCRWYDPYPRLVFGLKLIEMMPHIQQERAGQWLLDWLSRTMPPASLVHSRAYSGRWYDSTPPLAEALHILKMAPPSLIQQGSDVLVAWLDGPSRH